MNPLRTAASLGSLVAKNWSCVAAKNPATRRSVSTTVRIIALEDLPHGKAYKDDVLQVKPGYARNYLVPKKMAVYATPQNFEKLQIKDPNFESAEERRARLAKDSSMSAKEEQNLKQSDILKKYLKNKVLKMWRVVDPNSVDTLHPGYVTACNLRHKLSKQLKIDLDPTKEPVHIFSEEPIQIDELNDDKIQTMVDEFEIPPDVPHCQTKVKRLGTYLAKISLQGGYSVPLKFVVLPRVP